MRRAIYWVGRQDGLPPRPDLHYTEWVAEALRTGKIKIDPAKRLKEPVTSQDSCNYIRNYGLADVTPDMMSYLVEPGYFVGDDPEPGAQLLLRRRRRLERHRHRPRQQRNVGLKVKRDQNPGHRRQIGGHSLPQLLGRHPGPGTLWWALSVWYWTLYWNMHWSRAAWYMLEIRWKVFFIIGSRMIGNSG